MSNQTLQTQDSEDEMRHNVNETADKIRVQTKLKRGTGTRDQDTHNIKVRADSPEAAAERMAAVVAALEDRDVFADVREVGNNE
jgi:hypothetical protein